MGDNTLAERMAVVACIDPDAYTTGDSTTDVIDMRYFRQVTFIVMAGTLGSSATVDFVVYGDTASGGSYATAITGKSITQLTEAGTDSDKQAIINVTAEEVAAQTLLGVPLRYIRGTLSVGTATSDAGVIAVADTLRYSDARDYDLTSVDEVVL